MPIGNLAPPPLRSRLTDKAGLMTREFNNWLRGLTTAVNNAATQAVQPLVLLGLGYPLATSVLVPQTNQGLYRLSYSLIIARAATTSSSVAVTLQWTSNGVLQTFTSPAVTGNTTTSGQSGSVLAQVDGGSLISYATSYASVGGTQMLYNLAVTVEAMS